tara:strand:+ start:330 stop:512 length:183 start_codon:yes stop_codon:yes gene_type:complete
MSSLNDEVKSAAVVAEASTKALGRSILIGTVPILEFGALIALTLLIATIPLKVIRRIQDG